MNNGCDNDNKKLNLINLEKEKIYKNEIINLKEFPIKEIKEFYKEHLNLKNHQINVSKFKNKLLKKEIIDFVFYSINLKINTISVKRIYDNIISPLIGIFQYIENLDSIKDINYDDLKSKFKEQRYKSLINLLLIFKEDYYNDNEFDKDIWDIKNFKLSKDRINMSEKRDSINFLELKNKENKILIKKYILSLIGEKDLSINTIKGILIYNKIFIIFLNDLNIKDLERKDIIKFYEFVSIKYKDSKTYNHCISSIFGLLDYLNKNKIIANNYVFKSDYAKTKRTFKDSAIDKFVIDQIFNNLDKIDSHLVLIFLLIYCTGMRVSEACQIKIKDCIETSKIKEKDSYFIRYYSTKMKKEVTNIIPENLYKLIDIYRKSVIKTNKVYLVEFASGIPYQSSSFSKKIKNEFIKNNIKNTDGSQYIFRAHDYRHTIAKKMRERDIPYQFIQEQLHHESPEMTLSYIEYNNQAKINKMKNFIDINGNNAPIKSDINFLNEEAEVEWLRRFINTQILSNGVCAKPIKLGKCPHANSCLTCSDFRTSIDNLDILERQLKQIDIFLKFAEDNNLSHQIETNKKTKENLIKIINNLKG